MLSFTRARLAAPREVKGLSVFPSIKNPEITYIKLNRPKQKNSITHNMYQGIIDNFQECSNNPSCKAIVLTGTGDYYCSGNDLKNFFTFGSPKSLARDAKVMCANFVNAFIDCKKPIVAAVNGPAIGIAVTTLGLCDARFCVPSATFHTPFKALAQGPEGCSSYMFPKIMGKEMARKMLADGHTMSAEEAVNNKFVNEIVAEGGEAALWERCEKEAKAIIMKGSSFERECAKERVVLHEVNKMEVEYLEDAWVSKECFEALENFMAKKGNKKGAFMMKTLNQTRWLWDR